MYTSTENDDRITLNEVAMLVDKLNTNFGEYLVSGSFVDIHAHDLVHKLSCVCR